MSICFHRKNTDSFHNRVICNTTLYAKEQHLKLINDALKLCALIEQDGGIDKFLTAYKYTDNKLLKTIIGHNGYSLFLSNGKKAELLNQRILFLVKYIVVSIPETNQSECDMEELWNDITRDPVRTLQPIVNSLEDLIKNINQIEANHGNIPILDEIRIKELIGELLKSLVTVQLASLPCDGKYFQWGEKTIIFASNNGIELPLKRANISTSRVLVAFNGSGVKVRNNQDIRDIGIYSESGFYGDNIEAIIYENLNQESQKSDSQTNQGIDVININGSSAILGRGFAEGIEDAFSGLEKVINKNPALKSEPQTITVTGFSRGAVQAICFCHKLKEKYPTYNVNLLLLDPVKGLTGGNAKLFAMADTIPANVEYCNIVYSSSGHSLFGTFYDPAIPNLASAKTSVEASLVRSDHINLVGQTETHDTLVQFFKSTLGENFVSDEIIGLIRKSKYRKSENSRNSRAVTAKRSKINSRHGQ